MSVTVQGEQTVGELKAQLFAAQPPQGEAPPCVCVGGKRLPENGAVKLKDLDIDRNGQVTFCSPEAACGDAEMKPVKLGLERFLTLWIAIAVGVGIGVGQIPGVKEALEDMKVGNTNILTAIGMLIMLLPPFASVKYDEFLVSVRKIPKRFAVGSVVVNWIIGPFLMLFVGLTVLYDHADLLQGVVYIGAARCIAMVLVWNALAGGDQFLCVSLVLLNSAITVVLYTPIVTLLGEVALWLSVSIRGDVDFLTVLKNVLIYLGIPFVTGIAMWAVGRNCTGYREKFLPRFAPCGLLALLWTIVMMFADMSKPLLSGSVKIGNIFLVIIPLLLYFVLMFASSWILCRWLLRSTYPETVTFAFTAASNNFELALAAATAIFGTSSEQAVASVMGPLIEIPVMLAMVHVAKRMRYEDL